MKQRVTFSTFNDAFYNMGRANQFPEGLKALFDYLEDYEESTGEEIELNVIALCCDFSEHTLEEALSEYGMDSLEELQDHTTVIMVEEDEEDPGKSIIIVQAF